MRIEDSIRQNTLHRVAEDGAALVRRTLSEAGALEQAAKRLRTAAESYHGLSKNEKAQQQTIGKKKGLTNEKEVKKITTQRQVTTQADTHVEQAFVHFRNVLVQCGFPKAVELIAVGGLSADCPLGTQINGVYYAKDGAFSRKKCYQKLRHMPRLHAGVACDGVCISWNSGRSQHSSAKTGRSLPIQQPQLECWPRQKDHGWCEMGLASLRKSASPSRKRFERCGASRS